MNESDALILHGIIIGILSLYYLASLWRRRLFHWLSCGFWAWGSIVYYFIAAPLFIWFIGDRSSMEINLKLAGGSGHLLWITFTIAVGCSFFFNFYLSSRPYKPSFNLPQEGWPPGTVWVIIIALVFSAYTIVMYRSFGFGTTPIIMEGSKSTEGITGL